MSFSPEMLIPPAMVLSAAFGGLVGYIWGRRNGMNTMLEWVSQKLDAILKGEPL